MTFDNNGNPMTVQSPDAEKSNHNQIFPKYRLSKKTVKVEDEKQQQVDQNAIKNLKNARRVKIHSNEMEDLPPSNMNLKNSFKTRN